jgi:hypothetical protein
MEPAGQDLRGAFRPQVSDSTAPIAVKCQSFLDNVIAQFGRVRVGMIEAADQKNSGVQPPSPLEAVAQHAQLTEWRAAGLHISKFGRRTGTGRGGCHAQGGDLGEVEASSVEAADRSRRPNGSSSARAAQAAAAAGVGVS